MDAHVSLEALEKFKQLLTRFSTEMSVEAQKMQLHLTKTHQQLEQKHFELKKKLQMCPDQISYEQTRQELIEFERLFAGFCQAAQDCIKGFQQQELMAANRQKAVTTIDRKVGVLREYLGNSGVENRTGANSGNLDNNNKCIAGYEGIERFREKAGLEPYSIDSGNTVASVTVNNKTYFGVNSTITKESQMATKELRQKWLREIEWVPPKKTNPKHLGHAQSLTHAEAHSLIRAFERQGSLPKKVTMYVDRKTCNICRGELPALLKSLGVDELEIFSGGSTKSIIIKAAL